MAVLRETDIEAFVARHQALVEAYYKANYSTLRVPVIGFTVGPKYVRITTDNGSINGMSVVCFLDRSNGDILKADGWKKPAKHPRGNVFTEDMGDSCMTVYGAAYLR